MTRPKVAYQCKSITLSLSFPVFRIRIHLIRIRIQHFRLNTDPDPIRIQSVFRVLTKMLNFLNQGLQIYYPLPPTKDFQASEEAFIPKKRTPALRNMKFFSTFVGHFCHPLIRILIPNPDPDPLIWLHPDRKYWSFSLTLISPKGLAISFSWSL